MARNAPSYLLTVALYDGVPDATFVLPQTDGQEPAPALIQGLDPAVIEGPREIVFIDAGVENSDELLAGILESKPDATLEIRFIDADSDGIQQITDVLNASEGQYDAIHILSHGDDGQVNLGNSVLSAENLDSYADQLASWSDALTENADLLFYGCDLAGNAEGEMFVQSISAITGADVAASDDLTGSAEVGANWELELHIGQIDTAALSAENWDGHLAGEAIRINVGGQEHTDVDGNVFLADQFFNAGSNAGGTNDDVFIVGTGTNASNDNDADDVLFQTNRFDDNLTYQIPVENGIYNLRLHFAETFFNAENERVFDVAVEGVEVLDNYDIFGTRFNAFTPGHDASIFEEFFLIEVTDGFLTLNLESQGADGINNALLSAIEVLPITDPAIAPLPTNGSTIVAESGQTDSFDVALTIPCLLYTSPSPRDGLLSRMPSSA